MELMTQERKQQPEISHTRPKKSPETDSVTVSAGLGNTFMHSRPSLAISTWLHMN